jgi:putative ABC transport system permease protein
VGFAPAIDVPVDAWTHSSQTYSTPAIAAHTTLIGTWASHSVPVPDGSTYATGIEKTNPWWQVDGRWFNDGAQECVVGKTFAARAGVKIGDILNLNTPQKNLSLLVTGILSGGGPEDDAIVAPITIAQEIAGKPGEYRRLYVSALTKPEDEFGRRDPSTLAPADYDRWFCTPYISSIALQIRRVLPGADVRVIRRVADGEGAILTRVRTLLWLVTFASLLAAALAVGASSAASVIERRTEIGLMKALGAGSGTVGFLLAAEQLLLAFVGGGLGYALGILLARLVGQKIFGVAPGFSFLVLAVTIGLAAIVTLLGSAIPLRRASRYEPAPILRGE